MTTYDSTQSYPRDLVGYGNNPPHARWPGGARIAVQFVLNYEEGGENHILHGDPGSEQFLSEIIGAASFPARHMSMDGIYEYGSRAGVWRLLREFEQRGLPLTVFGVSMALERHPELTKAFVDLGHEIACHSWRWIHYQNMDEATEREHIERGTAIIRQMTGGLWPHGWDTRRRLRLRQRLLRRRPALLDDGRQIRRRKGAAAGDPLHAGRQRHALRLAAGFQHRRPLLRVPARQLRRAVCGR